LVQHCSWCGPCLLMPASEHLRAWGAELLVQGHPLNLAVASSVHVCVLRLLIFCRSASMTTPMEERSLLPMTGVARPLPLLWWLVSRTPATTYMKRGWSFFWQSIPYIFIRVNSTW
jgi:hypothetical protein